jgi:hypothetical protein
MTRAALAAAVVGMLIGGAARAQTASTYNPRDDQYRILGMTRAQAAFEQQLREYERKKDLQAKGFISASDLEEARARLENARVDYLQAALAIVFESPHVFIDRAVKVQRGDGAKLVRVTLRNESESTAEEMKLTGLIDSTLLRQLRPDEVNNVFVALKDEPGAAGVILGSPYERRIPVLRYGQPITLEFRLLRDVDALTISIAYANQSSERRVLLEKDASADIVTVQAAQFSQEADLGRSATYDLTLERFTSERSGFRLEVGGLPRDIQFEFRDAASGARLTQVAFPEGVTAVRLQLVLTLPQRDAGRFAVDRPITFWALALGREATAAFDHAGRDSLTATEAAAIPAGKARLELIPRGVARIEVQAPNLFHEISRGDSVTLEVTLRNTGSRAVSSVRLAADVQPDWVTRVTPELVPELDVGGEQRVRLTFVPPRTVAVGDYDIRVRTEALSADRRVDTEDKTVRVRVSPAANWLGTTLLVLLLVGLVGGIITFGLKLTRR